METKDEPGPEVDFAYWSKLATWNLDEAIPLSLGRTPGTVHWDSSSKFYVPEALEFSRRRELAERAVEVNELPLARYQRPLSGPLRFRPEQFLGWAVDTFDSIPVALVEAVAARAGLMIDRRSLRTECDWLAKRVLTLEAMAQAPRADKWPWGDHETELLRRLAAAADRYWKHYTPTDPTTAPKNEEVSVWLQEQGVSRRTAEIIATILRADGLPTGPR